MKKSGDAADVKVSQDFRLDVDLDAVAVLLARHRGVEARRIGRIGDGDVNARHVEESELEIQPAVEEVSFQTAIILCVCTRSALDIPKSAKFRKGALFQSASTTRSSSDCHRQAKPRAAKPVRQ
jgi:hypothetical protein